MGTTPEPKPNGYGRGRWAASLALALGGAAFLVAGCGGSPSSPGVASLGPKTPTTTGPAASTGGGGANLQQVYEQDIAFSVCMRAHGDLSFPDPVLVNNAHLHGVTMGNGVDPNSAQYKSANGACKHLLPNDGQGPSPAQLAQMLAKALKYATCMRSHGEPNFPDPVASANGISISLHGVDPSSVRFLAAQKACASLLPGGGP